MPKQLTVLLENRPGALGHLARTLAEADVNITSIMLEGSLDFGVARIHVDNVRDGIDALEEEGYQVQVGDAVTLPLENEPGRLAEICEELGKAQVNIESVFGTTGRSQTPTLILQVDDVEKAEEALDAAD